MHKLTFPIRYATSKDWERVTVSTNRGNKYEILADFKAESLKHGLIVVAHDMSQAYWSN